VRGCEDAARRALALSPQETYARVALAGLAPLFGNWTAARAELLKILSQDRDNAPGRHDLAVLEMATGRASAAVPLIAQLLEQDRFAATFHYKRMYHLWTMGDLHRGEQAAASALQLWPRHPAIWSARFWILVFTGRAEQAGTFAADVSSRPPLPQPLLEFLQSTAARAAALQAGVPEPELLSQHIAGCVNAAALGPAQAVSALLSLCAVQAIDQAFAVARGYYLGEGASAAPLRWNPGDPSISDQHRRITQPLFIPAAAEMRRDARFMALCEDMGLAAYWEQARLVPDFLL
jgi:hypothetical protein